MLWIKDWNWSLARFRSEVFSLLISCSRAAASHSANLLRKILQDYKHHLNTKIVTLTMCILLPWVGFVFTVNLCVLKNNNKKTTQDDTSSSCKKVHAPPLGLICFSATGAWRAVLRPTAPGLQLGWTSCTCLLSCFLSGDATKCHACWNWTQDLWKRELCCLSQPNLAQKPRQIYWCHNITCL